MKFHPLMAAALLLLAFDSGAVLLHPEAFPAPQVTAAAASPAQAQPVAPVAGTQPLDQPLPEPLPLSLLGAGFAMLGWTRRRGTLFGRLKLDLRRRLFPWPALSWLD